MNLGIKNLKVLVTAGAGGIGLEIARSFVAEGAQGACLRRRPEGAARARQERPEGHALDAATCPTASRWRNCSARRSPR